MIQNIVFTLSKKIDGIVGEIESLYNNTDSDISSAWNSVNARTNVSPKIEEIKTSINNIKDAIARVRERAGITIAAIEETDTAM